MALTLLNSSDETELTSLAGFPANASVTTLQDGGWVVAWQSDAIDPNKDIFFRRFDSSGEEVAPAGMSGTEIRANTITAGVQRDVDVAALDNGGWVMVWASDVSDNGNFDIYKRVYASDGTASAEEKVNIFTLNAQERPSVAAVNGGYVISWSSFGQDGTGFSVFQRHFTNAGAGVAINGITGDAPVHQADNSGTQLSPEVVGLSTGGWVISYDGDYSGGTGVVQTRFSAGGIAQGSPIKIADASGMALAEMNGGGWVAAWVEPSAAGPALVTQRYDSSGMPIGSSKIVNQTTSVGNAQPAITALADGGWVVAWEDEIGGKKSIYQRWYSNGGTEVSKEILVSTDAGASGPALSALPTGGWIITYSDGASETLQRQYSVSTTLQLSKSDIDENIGNAVIGTLNPTTTIDGSPITFQVSDKFIEIVDGNKVKVKAGAGFNKETTPTYTFTVTAPSGGSSLTQNMTITVNDVDEAPVGLTLTGTTIAENDAEGSFIGVVKATDPDGETPVYSLTVNPGGLFEIRNSNELHLKSGLVLDYENLQVPSVEVVLRAVDPNNQAFEITKPFTINFKDVNEAPGGTTSLPAALQINELSAENSPVATLNAIDPDAGDTVTYTLQDSAGGRFKLAGNQLLVDNGVALDFEQKKSHSVIIKATDAAGLSTISTLTVGVLDVTPEKTGGTSGADVIVGGAGIDSLSGGEGNDQLFGGANKDVLKGGTDNDRLDGGLGKDSLYGGSGKDTFLFTLKPAAASLDILRDFSPKDDTVYLENKFFKGIGSGSLSKPKKMLSDAFHLGKTAADAEDRILYDQGSGSLFYDPDGTGAAAAVRFAVVATKKALTLSDFYVI